MFFPPPSGPELTSEQRRILDDRFLSSNPCGYFGARIEMLLRWDESIAESVQASQEGDNSTSDAGRQTGQSRSRFSRYIGRSIHFPPEQAVRSATTQLATDAYALRHHAAESLVRMAACLMRESDLCLWEQLSSSPNQIHQVIEQLGKSFEDENASDKFVRMVVRQDDLGVTMSDNIASAVSIFADWLQLSADLLGGHALDLNAAHNKIKHGLAVRGRDDLRVTLTTSPPNPDGSVALSSLTGPGAIDIFDTPVLEVLARAPKHEGHKQGLELTQLRVDVPVILAESYMIAWTLGAMFSVQAESHFRGRAIAPQDFDSPVHPGYPVGGPATKHIASKAPVGMRFPLTDPPGGGQGSRPLGLGFRDTFIPLIQSGPVIRGSRVVAEEMEGTNARA